MSQYQVTAVFEAVDKITSVITGIEGGLKGLGKSMQTAGAVMTGAVTAPLALLGKAGLETALKVDRLERTLVGLAGGAQQAETYLKAISETSGGTIARVDQLAIANRALSFGIVQNADEMAQLTQIAIALGRAQGLDATTAVTDLSTALSRQSPLILDNLGITMKLSEAYDRYAQRIGKSVDELTDEEKAIAFRTEALAKGMEVVAKMGGVQDDAAASGERLNAMFSDAKALIGKALIPVMERLITFVEPLIQWFTDLDEGTRSWLVTLGLVVAVIGPGLVILGTLLSILGTIAGVLGSAFIPVLLAVVGIAALVALNFDSIAAAVEPVLGYVKKLGNYFQYVLMTGEPVNVLLNNMPEPLARIALVLGTVVDAFRRLVEGVQDEGLYVGVENFLAALGIEPPPQLWRVLDIFTVDLPRAVGLIKGIVEPVLAEMGNWFAALVPVLSTVGGWFASIWGIIGGVVLEVWTAIKPALFEFLGFLQTAIPEALATLRGFFEEVWAQIEPIISTAIEAIQGHVEKLTPIIQDIGVVAGEVVAWFQANWPMIQATVQQVFSVIASVIGAVVGAVVPFITQQFGVVVDWVVANWPLIKDTISTVLNAVWSVVQVVLNLIQTFWNAHGAAILNYVTLSWESIKTVISTAINVVLSVIKAVMQMITGDWEGAWETIKGIGESVWNAIKTVVQNQINQMLGFLKTDLATVTRIFKDTFEGAKRLVTENVTAIKNFITGFSLADAGRQLIQGLINGIRGMASSLISAATGVVSDAVAAAKRLLGIGSPSRVFAGFGHMMMLGMVQGIEGASGLVLGATNNVMGGSVAVAAAGAGGLNAGAGNQETHYHLEYHGYPRGEPGELDADRAMREIEVMTSLRR